MFEKTLQDIVKGIRASKRDTVLYISQCIKEIKDEINSDDMYIKANALQKLTFLHMMGYSMSWASFATIEVMSSPRFAQKRIGYLAASQGFTQDTDVILLATNLLKKELSGAVGGTGIYEAALAINCISNIVTEDLAQDLLPELTKLTMHSQPYLRKKALLCLFKVFIKYPQGLRLTFDKIQQCLGDSNPAVVSCAVHVITELSHTNPRNYLHLAPAFFGLLTNSNNNWMLIKVVKLLSSLVPEEPRLARKLLDPLAGIVRSTPAKSLLFEATYAITRCLPYCRKNDGSMPASTPAIVTLCCETFGSFVEENDQNLKYHGLVGFGSLVQSFPRVLSTSSYRPLILACLSDEDVTIRSRALNLLPSMASRKNLVELVGQLLQHIEFANGTYKLELVAKVVEMCSGEKYALLQDFRWYLDTLLQLGHMRGLDSHSELLRSQICDIALRVFPVRAYAVKRSMEVLLEGNNDNTSANIIDNGRGKHIMPEVLPALAWIVGEYSDLLPEAMTMDTDAVYIYNDSSEGPSHSILQAITAPINSNKLPASTQSVYLQASLKVFAATCANTQVSDSEIEACVRTIFFNIGVFMENPNVEVQERANTLNGLLLALELTSDLGRSVTPGLTSLDGEEDGSDDESDQDQIPSEGNLLGMSGMTLGTTPKSSDSKKLDPLGNLNLMGGTGKSLAARCRHVSSTLNYLLKPSPMKPTGGKAQRKKHQALVGADIDVNSPIDTSVFSSWIEEEKGHRQSTRPTMEAVSFTQQRPLTVSKTPKNIATDAVSSSDVQAPFVGDALVSSSSTANETPAVVSSLLKSSDHVRQNPSNTANDPFYLNSSASARDVEYASNPNANVANRFGSIQLGDDNEGEETYIKKKKKKKKNKKHETAQTSQQHMNFMGSGFGNMIYQSDDDDDDDMQSKPGVRTSGRKKGPERNGLANVDLSQPLREDEVFLERKHRVVPERKPEEAHIHPGTEPDLSKSKKKKKKKDSKKSKESKPQTQQATSNDFDLLDIFNATPQAPPSRQIMPSSSPAYSSNTMQHQPHAVNNAFDDLLGLSYPAPTTSNLGTQNTGQHLYGMSTPQSVAQPSSKSGSSGKKPYLRATIKPSSSSGSPMVDWSKVQLSYRVSRSQVGANMAASLIIRIQNDMEATPLSGLVLQLKNHGNVSIGDVTPHSKVESSMVGPFPYPSPDLPLEMKGKLATLDSNVTVKLTLPVSLHISPAGEGLTMDSVASELASLQWATRSTKIAHNSSMAPERIKLKVCTFLRMTEVEPSDPSYGTLAGTSSTGIPIRVLIKVKPDNVKLDIKSGSDDLGKALASELKRLII
eukprot:CAMPEP_0172372412 /NCGR_PEP_ID=MMETSP1060-20121228/47512_1 /TAXON_ID=37318 /ORGANISM="Pseudo-nitzschia pungens, Strain cf. cingulata" /LENGTH=1317 /DNA_ID=CAMNT_0013098403 /DNA_START=188 /DNA_END=4141 /DNA_ORIENTATION=+